MAIYNLRATWNYVWSTLKEWNYCSLFIKLLIKKYCIYIFVLLESFSNVIIERKNIQIINLCSSIILLQYSNKKYKNSFLFNLFYMCCFMYGSVLFYVRFCDVFMYGWKVVFWNWGKLICPQSALFNLEPKVTKINWLLKKILLRFRNFDLQEVYPKF